MWWDLATGAGGLQGSVPPSAGTVGSSARALTVGSAVGTMISAVALPPSRTRSSVTAMSDDLRRRGRRDDSFDP